MSRIQHSLRNVAASLGGQMLNNLMRLICRTVFIYTLGQEFLGISSLYANILTIFSMTELGLGTAITYSLYRPLAEGDLETVKSLMLFFRRAYRVIGLVILGLGLVLMPFLPHLMTGTTEAVNIYLYYLLYLSQAVISYLFFAYKSVLLIADQKRYVNDSIVFAMQVSINLVQILSLFLVRSFLVYTLISILGTAAQNILISLAADRRYPFLKEQAAPLTKALRGQVFSQVYATSLQQVCNLLSSAKDSLIISSNISVLVMGLYDNYYLIIQVIQKVISGFFEAFTSSLGNYYVTESKEQNLFAFRCMNLLNNWLVVFCSVSLAVLLQPFIYMWIGPDYLLEPVVVMLIVLNFSTNYLQSVVQIYRKASGLFVRGKYRAVFTTVIGLTLSLVLVKQIGLPGVFLGTIISRMVTAWWYDAWLLHRHGFGTSPVPYYLSCLLTLAMVICCTAAIQGLAYLVGVGDDGRYHFMLRCVLCVLLPNGLFIAVHGRSPEFRNLLQRVKNLLHLL